MTTNRVSPRTRPRTARTARSSPRDGHALAHLRQDGVATVRQLRALGVGSGVLAHRCRPGGPWQRLLPRTYLFHNGPPTARQRTRAALLYAGDGAMLTGPEALRLFGLRYVPPLPGTHVLVPCNRYPGSRDFVTVLRSRHVPRPRNVAGFPTAPLPRALVDTTRLGADLQQVRAACAEAVQRGRCSVEALTEEILGTSARGIAPIRAVIQELLAGVRSVSEAQAREVLRTGGLPEPLWNATLLLADGTFLATPDGYWPDTGVVLEIDSREYHLSPADWHRTMNRRNHLASHGLHPLAFTPAQLRHTPTDVIRHVAQALTTYAGCAPTHIRAVPIG
ncbi:hypothetical protein C8250_020260 [Streptomyces sp. So13.3]|uniref:hypothetical protein n=1 Tax=Streptomyces sp. So13.3 TaxID=2136173 RepID=UPI001105FFA7|nr:hypothetical protein [Streptomyces sp. So13.3]QNA73941.1 hypothetical protein C8250_020260 [Streptomyces sp. So13.3]